MAMIIKKSVALCDIEDLLVDIENVSKSSLRLPSKIRLGGIGVEVALVQLIISWSRKQRAFGEMHTYLDSIDEAKNFVTTLYGLIASTVSPRITLIDHAEIKRRDILEPASDLIKKMDAGDLSAIQRGPSLFMTSISGARLRYIKPIYKGAGQVKSPSELAPVVREMLNVVGNASGDKKGVAQVFRHKGFYDNISWLLFELFQNTEDHAQRDCSGELYKRTVSGFKISIQKIIDPDDWERILPSSNFDWLSASSNVRLLELSVFDSGPGMARRWLSKEFEEFSFDEERDSIIECFNKNQTSKGISGRGIGLNNFLTILSGRRGFFRVRSGRIELIKSFSSVENEKIICSQDFSKEQAPVEGTLISAFIPLVKENCDG